MPGADGLHVAQQVLVVRGGADTPAVVLSGAGGTVRVKLLESGEEASYVARNGVWPQEYGELRAGDRVRRSLFGSPGDEEAGTVRTPASRRRMVSIAAAQLPLLSSGGVPPAHAASSPQQRRRTPALTPAHTYDISE